MSVFLVDIATSLVLPMIQEKKELYRPRYTTKRYLSRTMLLFLSTSPHSITRSCNMAGTSVKGLNHLTKRKGVQNVNKEHGEKVESSGNEGKKHTKKGI